MNLSVKCLTLALLLLAGNTFVFSQQDVQSLIIETERDNSGQKEAKKLCVRLGLPLSIYVYDQALIEAIKTEGGDPVYLVRQIPGGKMSEAYLATYPEILSKFDLSEARMYYGNGKLVNDRKKANTTSNPLLPGLILLIPESTNDRVMSFDPITGDLLNADFIPADPANLFTAISAIQHPTTKTNILISDQLDDDISLYGNDGNFIQTFFGGNPAVMTNVRGIEVKHDQSSILATVASGSSAGSIQEFDLNGNHLGMFISSGLGGLDTPFDVLYHATSNSYLVSNVNTNAIHHYDINGNFLGIFASNNIDFPEQVTEFADGRVGLAIFAGQNTNADIMIFSSAGTLLNTIDIPNQSGFRGVYLLGNGNLLVTLATGVYEIDFSGNIISTKIEGVSARFIEEFRPPVVEEEVPVLSQWLIICVGLSLAIVGLVFQFNAAREKF